MFLDDQMARSSIWGETRQPQFKQPVQLGFSDSDWRVGPDPIEDHIVGHFVGGDDSYVVEAGRCGILATQRSRSAVHLDSPDGRFRVTSGQGQADWAIARSDIAKVAIAIGGLGPVEE